MTTQLIEAVVSAGVGALVSKIDDLTGVLDKLSPRNTTKATDGAATMGRSTFGGTDGAAKNMQRWADRHPLDGYTDVIGRGSPHDVAGMSASELAAKLPGETNVRLLSCQTGCPSGTFAQDLADEMGVRVMAPTTDIGASSSGKTIDMYGGEFRCFIPGGKGPAPC